MGLLLLGSIILCYWAFLTASQKFEESSRWLVGRLSLSAKSSFSSFAMNLIPSVMLTHSPYLARKAALGMLENGSWSARYSLFLLCIASFASVIWMGFSLFVFQVLGGFLLVAAIPGFITKKKLPNLSAFFWMFFFLGLFLQTVETVMRTGNFVTQDPVYQNIVFALADNRILTVALWALLSTLFTFLLPLEALSFVISILGLSLGVMSLNVAMALVMGETLGMSLRLWWNHRGPSGLVTTVTKEVAALSLGALLVFGIVFVYLRGVLPLLQILSYPSLADRLMVFICSFAGWTLFHIFILSVWGHFRSQVLTKN